ncbi:AAA family ATPase [Saccharomonospora cyanea]|uniref:Thymidylate kinase n=1 Tax=Saccharomonospora cyanea NA-134 TaxID=882082 RepID=H5XLY5_9PSEU|nr:AAA family ATPase [Saccharomonospora cyanea]EHR62027.1 thymidylate kinase [Saccharomonospora cyanea NA-134]
MLVWINGAFGSGKTTLADVLHDRLPEALAFDPEYVGCLLRQSVPDPVADFQDIPLWRSLTAEFAAGLCREYRRPLIVPMTLVDTRYRDEVFGGLGQAGVDILHVWLDVPAAELRRRIENQVLVPDDEERDEQARRFRLGNVDRCVAAGAELPPGTLVLPGDQLRPEELADRVVHTITTREEPAADGLSAQAR